MKRVLVPVVPGGVRHLPLQAAVSLAGHFGASIVVTLYQPRTDEHAVDPMSWGLTAFASQESLMADEVAQARAEVEQALAAAGLSAAAPSVTVSDRSLLSWRDLGQVARVFDLAAISREALFEHSATAIEQLLFESGRPMLLAPGQWSRPVGDCVAIAWNRSAETARLVGLAIALLRCAREVHVIDIEDWHVDGPDGRQLTDYLQANGVAGHLHAVERGRGEFGGRVLQETHSLGADLLLKGAYTQSRLSQVMFGGATRDILSDAYLPVLFAH